ncbi:MAG: hypothetical protein AAGU32_06320 [Bacillota bacterium]
MFKLGCHRNNETQEYYYSDLYNVEQKSSYERIVIGLAQGHINTVLDLTAVLNEPFYMLYILHTPRTGNKPGRYQSQAVTYDNISMLLKRFKNFFENDARHDLWIHSPKTNTTIIYDRHNLIYLYGFTDEQVHIIEKKSLKKESINIPCPHVHCYNSEYDIFESELVNEYQWIRTQLHDEDI